MTTFDSLAHTKKSLLPLAVSFDLDGTLCDHGGRVTNEVADFLAAFKARNQAYVEVVTASTVDRTLDRVSALIDKQAVDYYSCGHGTSLVDKDGRVVWRAEGHPLEPNLMFLMQELRAESEFPYKTDPMVQGDGACWSFSVLGKNFTPEQKVAYVEHDERTKERERIVGALRTWAHENHESYHFYKGGMTGIDVVPLGFGKERVVRATRENCRTYFYVGDDAGPYGGDEGVAEYLQSIKEPLSFVHVRCPADTIKFLVGR